VFSYFKGKPSDWKTGLPTYTKVVYRDLWPGIDLVYSGTANRLKYEFVVKPDADPKEILLAYRGVSRLEVTESGALRVVTQAGGFEDGVPQAWQEIHGERREVSMRYALGAAKEEGVFSYGFAIGDYDRGKPLVLDPAILVYCGYFGGSDADYGHGIAVDGQGNAYVTGNTYSDESTFPVKAGPDLSFNGGHNDNDAFVAKVTFGEIIADIKANGSDGPITINAGTNLKIEVTLDPGVFAGMDADFFVIANASSNFYHFSLSPPGWVPGLAVTHQGPLISLGPKEVLNYSGLPKGTYVFYFAVDTDMNGLFESDKGAVDSVEVTIS